MAFSVPKVPLNPNQPTCKLIVLSKWPIIIVIKWLRISPQKQN